MWWHASEDGRRLICDLCPRHCSLGPGERGFCFVREHRDGRILLTTYGRNTGLCIDPIEKKPLHHFYPGTSTLSFGTPGCNLGCIFCQNWTLSRSRNVEAICRPATPRAIAAAAQQYDCRSVAFTYNDPIIWAEYAIDTARECRAVGVQSVAVTSGYISAVARAEFFEPIQAANVDLKGFSDSFYRQYCGGRLQPVLDTLSWLVHQSSVWVEITNLVIPEANDSPEMIRPMCRWIVSELGPDVPLHFSAFHPDFQMTDHSPTPAATLRAAYDIARDAGLHYIYTGNVVDPERQHTYCPGCGQAVICRAGYSIQSFDLRNGRCMHCKTPIAGRFDETAGRWGEQRRIVELEN
ncbi:MAG: AmmeMemoRadiSam system radical SAM enzyme [Thermoguttaceae bacterium]